MEESFTHIVVPVPFAEETRLNKFQSNPNRFRGPASRHFSLRNSWSLLHEMHVVGSSAYGKRTGHSGHTGLVACSELQYFIGTRS